MEPKHIVHVSNDFEPITGGINTHLINLLSYLPNYGLDVSLLVPQSSETGETTIRVDDRYESFRVVRSSFPKVQNVFNQMIRFTKATTDGLKWIEQHTKKPDLIHQHDNRATRIGATHFGRRNNIPVIWTNHSSGFLGKSDLSARMLTYIPGIRPDGVIVVHQMLLKGIHDFFKKCDVRYIPNGVNLDDFQPVNEVTKKDTVILFPQRMIPQKGIEELAKAAKILLEHEDRLMFKFWFAGSQFGSNRDSKLIRRIKELLAEEVEKGNVRFLGNPSYKEMPKFYRQADIVVLPFKMGTESLSVFEAWASATPVISLRLEETNKFILEGENCILVDNSDPQLLTHTIRDLAVDLELRDHLAESGLRTARDHCGWNHRAEKTAEFYREILNAGHE